MIRITINGIPIELEKPVTVLEAAKRIGITIPTLCHHDLLKPVGSCRLCLVEVENIPRLQTSCTLRTANGMVIKTETEAIVNARKGILEFLLINHPLDCPVCDKAGECRLQDLVDMYGMAYGRYREKKRIFNNTCRDPIIARNMQRCIMCTRCVRMCDDIQGAQAIAVVGRGNESRIEAFSNERYNCEYCGNCITVCPVGSILSRPHVHSFRGWQITHETDTVCGYCGVGCSLTVQLIDDTIKRVYPKAGKGVNKGVLCVRGRFGYEYVNNQERLKTPLIRKNDKLYHCSWEEACDYVVKRLTEIKNSYGPEAIAGIASTRCTNESAYVFQKFMRAVIGTNNIDSSARLSLAGPLFLFESILGTGITANSFEAISQSSNILVLGGDPTRITPVLGLQIRAAYRNGANVFTCGSVEGLRHFTTLSVQTPIYGEEAMLERLAVHIYRDRGSKGSNLLLERWLEKKFDILNEEKAVTIPKVNYYRFLELFYKRDGATSIILGPDLVQRSNGYRSLICIAALIYLLNARLYILSEGPNAQGITDMGCMPDLLPGYVPVSDEKQRHEFEEQWKSHIPKLHGLTLMEIIEASLTGKIKALYVMGENPAFNFPDNAKMSRALKKLDLLVAQDNFLTRTADMAHVVLPSKTWAELNGTYANMERRVQFVRKAVKGTGKQDWRIVSDIAKRMGYSMEYPSSEHVLKEIIAVNPLYRGLSREVIDSGKNLWPYNGKVITHKFDKLPGERKTDVREIEGIIHLKRGWSLFHWDTLSQKCPILCSIEAAPFVNVSSAIFKEYGFNEGDTVIITSPFGELELHVTEDPLLESDTVMMFNIFESKGVFSLSGYTLDPVTKVPGIDGWKVRIRRVIS